MTSHWSWLAALIAGTVLFALDLPYILLACHTGFCDASFDGAIGTFVMIKGIVAGGLLGWISASTSESVPRAFLVGSIALSVEGAASGGLMYTQSLTGVPNASDIASIPVDIAIGMVAIFFVGGLLGGWPAMLAAYLRSIDRLIAATMEISKDFEQPRRTPQRGSKRSGRKEETHKEETLKQTAQDELSRLARRLGIPYLSLLPRKLPRQVQQIVDAKLAQELHCYPLGRERNMLTVAMLDPQDDGALERLRQETGLHIFPVLTHPEALENALKQLLQEKILQPEHSRTLCNDPQSRV